jgi:hypothetical protein
MFEEWSQYAHSLCEGVFIIADSQLTLFKDRDIYSNRSDQIPIVTMGSYRD